MRNKTAWQSEQAHHERIKGNQPNDPDKSADLLIAISKEENLPVHLLLGKDAFDFYQVKLTSLPKTLKNGKATDCPLHFNSDCLFGCRLCRE